MVWSTSIIGEYTDDDNDQQLCKEGSNYEFYWILMNKFWYISSYQQSVKKW